MTKFYLSTVIAYVLQQAIVFYVLWHMVLSDTALCLEWCQQLVGSFAGCS